MTQSPIAQLLAAIDKLDLDSVVSLLGPEIKVLSADGRRSKGTEAVQELLSGFLSELRSTTHRITDQWHIDDVWIAEVDATYELQDWLQLTDLPRIFVVRMSADGIAELRTYGAHERPLTDHRTGEEGTWIGSRWVPPL